MLNFVFKKLFFLFHVIFIMATVSLAQPPDGGGDDEDPDEGIPIDGGVSLLAAAGIGYGVKKVYDSRKKEGRESNDKESQD